MNWKERLEYNKQILDTLPIEDYMYPGQQIYDLMDTLVENYEYLVEHDDILEGFLFSEYDAESFGQYLRDRYNVPICERITYAIGWYKENGTNL